MGVRPLPGSRGRPSKGPPQAHADYHKPSDTWEKINSEAAVGVLGIVAEVADDLRVRDGRPEFVREQAAN